MQIPVTISHRTCLNLLFSNLPPYPPPVSGALLFLTPFYFLPGVHLGLIQNVICTHMHMRECIISSHMYMYVYMYTFEYLYTYIYIYIYVCICIHIYHNNELKFQTLWGF